MLPIRYLPPAAIAGLALAAAAHAAEPSLGEAVKQLDGKYLDAPEIGLVDESPKITAGGGEEGLPPLEEEIALGPLRVTLTYVAEEPHEAEATPAHDLPGEAEDATINPGPAAEAEGEIPPEEIPEEAMLPEEQGLGETMWQVPIVTVYFDDPNPKAPAPAPEENKAEAPAAPEPEGNQPAEAAPEEQPTAETEPAETGPRVVARLEGNSAGSSDPPVSVQIAELDPGNPYPEVVVSFFTGGDHCCSVTSVVTADADGSAWSVVPVGEFDGGPMLAVDLDADGVYELETRDNAFLTAFACYSCSEAPLQVLALRGGKIEDVSTAPRYRAAHAAWLGNMILGVPEQEVNGFLAGYVAEKIRLGEGKPAWDLMLKYYDRNTDWGLEICDQERDEAGACPGETTKVTFPEALERMLNEKGYKISG